ncbi:helix-turn-helix domain-containing protein [Mycobacterium antarcticum]|uniref:helix-turn-helix domain-containing protein n=1 Tax=Mycolicibacterium sp. TUM20984 TaxID=3023368 RepID=UPI0023935FBE|nr:helix-turn-helix domain-containing protein [Mycolicibacterium sp. TUM20984]GLP83567.1 hypothetical protein TUM20984_49870 [Mycolicibacterium sp. TUM20984]
MNFSHDDLEVAYYVFSRFINGRIADGKNVPSVVLPLFRRIELMSVCGHESDSSAEQLDAGTLIGTAEVAHLLKCDPRTVRRLRSDLGGWKVGRDWVFNRSAVIEYEESRSAHRRAS